MKFNKKSKKILTTLFIVFIFLITSIYMILSLSVPSLADYEYSPMLKTKIVTTKDKLVGEIYKENRTIIASEDIPQNMKNAIVAVEDRRFYKHNGFDIKGIMRAITINMVSGSKSEGASTITQQVVRRLFLSDERTYERKIKEILLAIKMEQVYTKDEILEIYLNDVFYGENSYGIEEASKRFFDKSCTELKLEECALLASLPQAPSLYNPTTKKGLKLAKERQKKVLDDMEEIGYITKEQCEKAKKAKLKIQKKEKEKGFNGRIRKGCGAYSQQVLYEAENILVKRYMDVGKMTKEKAKQYVTQLINERGLKITCTLNTKLQEAAYSQVDSTLESFGIKDVADLAYATVNIKNGRVVAYFGGTSQIDMADVPRQPGSTIKPLYVSKALEQGVVDVYSTVYDGFIDINGYQPKNYGNKYYGNISVKQAITRSANTACLRVYEKMGVQAGVDGVKEFGFTTIDDETDYTYAFALGGLTYGFKPVELASAYSAFGNNGKRYPYYFVEKIENKDGKVLYEREAQKSKRVLSEEANEKIVDCMKDVVNYGTGYAARNDYETFGKTGTTSDDKDFWFAGVTDKYASAVWIGTPNNDVISYASSSWAARFYGNYMLKASENGTLSGTKSTKVEMVKIRVVKEKAEKKDYYIKGDTEIIEVPSTDLDSYEKRRVKKVIVDRTSGLIFDKEHCRERNKEERYYIMGTEPKEKCDKFHLF